MGVGIHLGISIWDCLGIAIESCVAHGIIIRLNNIIIKVELCLATQIRGIVVGGSFYVVVGMRNVLMCQFFCLATGYHTLDHQPQTSVGWTRSIFIFA